MAVQQWKTKLLRWQQLTRYYTNKWQYDGAKWAERIWYGTGTGKVRNAVASVPFMITRNMRAQLEQRGFPAHEISALLPKLAHELIHEQVSYAQFQTQRARYETAQQQQQEQQVAAAVEEIKEIVATIQAREAQEAHGSDAPASVAAATPDCEPAGPSAANQIAIVPDQTDAKETHERL